MLFVLFVEILCPLIFAPVNGTMSCTIYGHYPTVGDDCRFACKSGFVLYGTKSTTCTSYRNNGRWSPDNTKVCCELNYVLCISMYIVLLILLYLCV